MAYRVAVYGGSFSPFGNNHLSVIQHVADSGEFDEIVVVPSIAHALKKTTFPYEHRVNMAKLALWANKFSLPVECWTAEMTMLRDQPGPIFTIQLLRFLKTQIRHETRETPDLKFIVGPDIIEQLDRWAYVDEIRKEFGFVEVPDQGIHATEIRKRIAEGNPAWKDQVPPAVAKYIEMHKLYQEHA